MKYLNPFIIWKNLNGFKLHILCTGRKSMPKHSMERKLYTIIDLKWTTVHHTIAGENENNLLNNYVSFNSGHIQVLPTLPYFLLAQFWNGWHTSSVSFLHTNYSTRQHDATQKREKKNDFFK